MLLHHLRRRNGKRCACYLLLLVFLLLAQWFSTPLFPLTRAAEAHDAYKAHFRNGIDPRTYLFSGGQNGELDWSSERARQRLEAYSGRHTHIILFDSGVDRHFFDFHNAKKGSSSSSNVNMNDDDTAPIECVSVVPGVSCFDMGNAHGTYSASVIVSNVSQPMRSEGAGAGNSGAYLGIAPRAHLTIVRIFDTHMETQPLYIQKALEYVYDRLSAPLSQTSSAKGPRRRRNIILSFSYGSDPLYRYFAAAASSPIAQIMNRLRHIHRDHPHVRLLFVSSAGNEGPRLGTITEPSDHVDWLTVGALQLLPPPSSQREGGRKGRSVDGWMHAVRRRTAPFSGRGPVGYTPPTQPPPHAPHFITKPNVLALGQHVRVVRGLRPQSGLDGNGTGHGGVVFKVTSGTSIATPIVAAVASLVMESLDDKLRAARCEAPALSLQQQSNEEKFNSFCYFVHQVGFVHVVKSLLLRSARPLTPSATRQRNKKEKESEDVYTSRYLDIVSYSYNAQGAGEVRPLAALDALEKLYNDRRSQRRRHDGTAIPSVYVFPPLLYNKVKKQQQQQQQPRKQDRQPYNKPPHHADDNAEDVRCLLSFPYCTQPLFFSATPLQYVLTVFVKSFDSHRGVMDQMQQINSVQARVHEVEEVFALDGFTHVQASTKSNNFSSFIDLHVKPLSHNRAFSLEARLQSPLLLLLDVSIYATREAQLYLDARPSVERVHLNGTLTIYLNPLAASASTPSSFSAFSSVAPLQAEVGFVLTIVAAPPKQKRVFLDLEHYWHANSLLALHHAAQDNYTDSTSNSNNNISKEAKNLSTYLFIPGSDPHEGQLLDIHPNPNFMTGKPKRFARRCDRDAVQQPFSHIQNNLLVFYLYLRLYLRLYVELFPVSFAAHTHRAPNGNTLKEPREYFYRHIHYYLLFSPQKPLLEKTRRFLQTLVRPSLLESGTNVSDEGVSLIVLGDWYTPRRRGGEKNLDETPTPSENNIAQLLRYPLYFCNSSSMYDRGVQKADTFGGACDATPTSAASPFRGLAGHAHIPSLNKLLRGLAAMGGSDGEGRGGSTIQFVNQIIDGLLQIPLWHSQEEMRQFYVTANDSGGSIPVSTLANATRQQQRQQLLPGSFPTTYARSLGVLSAANTLAFVPTQSDSHRQPGEREEKEEEIEMILCHLHPTVAEKQQALYKTLLFIAPEAGEEERGSAKRSVVRDAWKPRPKRNDSHEVSGILGFISFPGRRATQKERAREGKVAIFTDTSCFSNFNNHFQAQVHRMLDEETEEGSRNSPDTLSSFFCFEVLHWLLLAASVNDNSGASLQFVQQYAALQCQSPETEVNNTPTSAAAAVASSFTSLSAKEEEAEEKEFESLYRLLEEGAWPTAKRSQKTQQAREEKNMWETQLHHMNHYDEEMTANATHVPSAGAVTEDALQSLFFFSQAQPGVLREDENDGGSPLFPETSSAYQAWGLVMVCVNVLFFVVVALYFYFGDLRKAYRERRKKVL